MHFHLKQVGVLNADLSTKNGNTIVVVPGKL